MRDVRPITRIEARIAGFLTSHKRKLYEHGQLLSSEPTQVELAQFLDPDHHNNIKIWDDIERLSSAVALIPRWFVLVSIGMLFALAIWAPPERGVTPLSLAGRLLGCLALTLLLFISVYMLNATLKAKGIYFIYDKLNRTLELPRYKITLVPDQVRSFFMLQVVGSSCELSVLTEMEEGRLVRYSLGINARAKKLRELGKALGEYLSVPFSTLKLDRKARKALGLKWKDVWNT
ncbi:MAG: hypothetical protein ACYTDW_02490 [Planctomycetota bacterium]|jgi:hypothetical protein